MEKIIEIETESPVYHCTTCGKQLVRALEDASNFKKKDYHRLKKINYTPYNTKGEKQFFHVYRCPTYIAKNWVQRLFSPAHDVKIFGIAGFEYFSNEESFTPNYD